MSIVPGSKIGKFKLESQLGGGGMGSVFKARDTSLDRTVAIKILNAQHDYSQENLERFEREAHTLASLNHPNLMHVYDVGIKDNVHYFAMEYIRGRSLREMISDPDYTISNEEALRITIEIMAGLRKVHNSGIIHRDIKPANIMIESGDGRAILVDFGLSKSAEDSGLTSAGSILGTPDYISPEQIEGFEAGYQSDIYSLGVVLYEMISGENPYTRESSMKTIRAHCNYTPPSLRELSARTPRELSRIVDKMLAVQPEKRYQSIAEVAIDLRKVCRHPLLDKLARDDQTRHPDTRVRHACALDTPYRNYISQTPKIHHDFPFWKYFSTVTALISLLLVMTFYYSNRQNPASRLLPYVVSKQNLPVVHYTPDGCTRSETGSVNPSVILKLSNHKHIWGRVLDGIHENRISIGLFPRGQAEYPLEAIESIIIVDSEAISDHIPNADDFLIRKFLNSSSSETK